MSSVQFPSTQPLGNNHLTQIPPATGQQASPAVSTRTLPPPPPLVPDDDAPTLEGRVDVASSQLQQRQAAVELFGRNLLEPGEGATLDEIPIELLSRCIFTRLSPEQVACLSGVCKVWQKASQDNILWNYFLQSRFSEIAECQDAKAVFKRLYRDANLKQGIYTIARGFSIDTPDGEVHTIGKGRLAKTCTKDEKIEIWNLKTGLLECALDIKDADFSYFAFMDQGRGLLFKQDKAQLWNLETQKIIREIDIDIIGVALHCALNSQDKLFILNSFGWLRVWSFTENKLVDQFQVTSDNSIAEFFLLDDGKRVVFSSEGDASPTIWNLETKQFEKAIGQGRTNHMIGWPDEKIGIFYSNGDVGVLDIAKGGDQKLYRRKLTNKCKGVGTKEGNLLEWHYGGDIRVLGGAGQHCDQHFNEFQYFFSAPRALKCDLYYQSSNGELVLYDAREVKVLNFAASHTEVFAELANQLESGGEEAECAMIRFARMPDVEKEDIYKQLHLIKDASEEGSAEPVSSLSDEEFFKAAAPQERARAIRNYLDQLSLNS